MRPFDKIFTHFWIIRDFRFYPLLLCVLFLAYKSGMLGLTIIIGGSFGSPPKVLRMTKGVGPWLARSGHRGSKRVKTCPPSAPYLTLREFIFLARNLMANRFWPKFSFGSGFRMADIKGTPPEPFKDWKKIFEAFFEMAITFWIEASVKLLGCQKFSFEPNFWMLHEKLGKLHLCPLQLQKCVFAKNGHNSASTHSRDLIFCMHQFFGQKIFLTKFQPSSGKIVQLAGVFSIFDPNFRHFCIFRENASCHAAPRGLSGPPLMIIIFWDSVGSSGTVVSPKKDPTPAPYWMVSRIKILSAPQKCEKIQPNMPCLS